MRKSPFKFLDSYTADDKDIFFGRTKEVESLYNMVFKTPLVLVYGLSGTGKTSLVQCGLSMKFEQPDWLPILVRRGKNINASLQEALEKPLVEKPYTDPKQAIDDLFYTYFRPVYLIFDQFEELFILGDYEEQKTFISNIQQLMEKELPCKIILIMREEYIGQLYHFEKYLPHIFDFKLRVEPMVNKQVQEVIFQSFEQFNIQLEAPKEQHCQLMIDNISIGKSGIPLTYLQVYLDMLYREDFERTYPNGSNAVYPELTFTKAEIEQFGQMDDVLDRFLKEKTVELQAQLEQRFPNCPSSLVTSALDLFVTEEGTKRPIHYKRIKKHFQLEDTVHIADVSDEMLSACIEELESYRILRVTDDTIELAHDSLGLLIDQNRTDEQRLLNRIKMRLNSMNHEFQETGQYLSEKQLLGMEEYFPQLAIEPNVQQFIDESYQTVQAKKEQALALQRRKLEEQKQRAEKEKKQLLEKQQLLEGKQRKQKQLIWVLSISGLVFICLASYAFYAKNIAQSAEHQAQLEAFRAEMLATDGLKVQGKYQEALNLLKKSANGSKTEQQLRIIIQKQDTISKVFSRMSLVDSLLIDTNYQAAFNQIQVVQTLSNDGFIEEEIRKMEENRQKNLEEISKVINSSLGTAKRSSASLQRAIRYYDMAQKYRLDKELFSIEKEKIDRLIQNSNRGN